MDSLPILLQKKKVSVDELIFKGSAKVGMALHDDVR
jgi:hypothetical protein